MKVIQGDIIALALSGQLDVLVHGCNCFCSMGAGLAAQIAQNFPEAREVDQETTSGDRTKLGNFSSVQIFRGENSFEIVNAYTQYHYSGTGTLLDYEALRNIFKKIKLQFSGKRIAYPKIGAGLARGDWTIISQIIDEELDEEVHFLVEFVVS